MIFVKIKNITKKLNKEPVYDILGVPDNHNFIANNMVVHNCDLYGRGVGAVFVKDNNPVHDTWRLKDFLKLSAYNEFTPKSTIERELKKHPNFWQRITFPKPSDELYNKYLSVREMNVYDDSNILANVSKEDIHAALLILALRDIMMHDTTLSMNRITLHISNEYGINLPKSAIQGAIEDSKQLVMKIQDKTIEL
jgi:hypothetical protein